MKNQRKEGLSLSVLKDLAIGEPLHSPFRNWNVNEIVFVNTKRFQLFYFTAMVFAFFLCVLALAIGK
jgi:hypothetical protein